jgi:hypothetical protein
MQIAQNGLEAPFFSICIPQYNRTSFLLEALKVLSQQTFRNFEVCISDDCSSDGREQEIISYLENSGLAFVYQRQQKNLRYDGNLRASIGLAKGNYCFLHGNDDCLTSSTTLQGLYDEIVKYKSLGVVITNYEDWASGNKVYRVSHSRSLGHGPAIAAANFRNVAFVSGVLLHRESAQRMTTDKWDGSEMYQMFLMGRIIASGADLLELNISAVRKDIQISGESVERHTSKPKLRHCPIIERIFPLSQIGRLITDAIEPYLHARDRNATIEKIILQLYCFTYPFWILEYRRVQSWKYSVGVCLGMRPKHIFGGLGLGTKTIIKLYMIYFIMCGLGLTMPLKIFAKLRPILFKIAKSFKKSK